jgi:hypothetical protein
LRSQSRAMSAVEATSNVVVGFLVAWAANVAVLPAFGLRPSVADSFLIAVVFTAISFIRSYLLRRTFEAFR